MTRSKLCYTAPEADLLVVRFEENVLLSGGEPGQPGQAGGAFDNIFDYPSVL
ncbi:MAG: hypothetical protein J5835_01315 [Bacteroidales bacterium]|nr:hypothetical protein [Bacteroidales bacterium]